MAMARTLRDAALDSRAARSRLAPRGKPYFRTLEAGLHLGYRKTGGRKGKPATAGKWVARHYVGDQAYVVETIATADDMSDANGLTVLTFAQAQTEARKRRDDRAHGAAGHGGPFTVAAAIALYVHSLKARGKDAADTEFRANAMILPSLGKIEIARLSTDQIRQWFMALAEAPPRLRTAKGKAQRYRKVAVGHEMVRRRHSTANRILAILKAALSHAYREGKIASDEAWRRVKAFENASAAKTRYLSVLEAQRLLNACEPDFRAIVHAGLLTGCRYGELGRLTVADFRPDSGTLAILRSKTGKPRHVVLTEEGVEFFKQLCAGRGGNELLLRKSNGAAWGKSHQIPEMVGAVARARISPPISFHGLRHSYASLSVMGGVPLMVVAENLGHADTRMVQKHYGHLSKSYVADAIRAGAPRFGFKPDLKVATIR